MFVNIKIKIEDKRQVKKILINVKKNIKNMKNIYYMDILELIKETKIKN